MEELLREILHELKMLNERFALMDQRSAQAEIDAKEKIDRLSSIMPTNLQSVFKTFSGGKQ